MRPLEHFIVSCDTLTADDAVTTGRGFVNDHTPCWIESRR